MSEIRVTDIKGEDGSAAVNFSKGINISSGVCTATSFSGSGANLTSLPAGQLTGALPAISGANLTGIAAGILQVKQVKTTAYVTTGSSFTDITGFYLDDHNTTNAITYKVQHKYYSGGGGTNKDWSGNLNGVSTFTVIEIDSSVIS